MPLPQASSRQRAPDHPRDATAGAPTPIPVTSTDKLPASRLRQWLHRRRWPLAITALLVCAVLVTLFHPRLQTRVLRDQMGARVDRFEVERVHLLPWSLSVSGLELAHQGVVLHLRDAELGFSPWQALFRVVAVNRLAIAGLGIDTRGMPPAADPAPPFPGLFTLLDHGWGVALDGVAISGEALPAADLVVEFRLGGGGLAPQATGTLDLDLVATRAGDGARIEVAGPVSLTQGDAGTISAVAADLLALVAAQALPDEEIVAIELSATPLREPAGDPDAAEATRIAGDRFELVLAKPGGDGDLVRLGVTGTYDADAHVAAGDFELGFDYGLVLAYAPEARVPRFSERGHGTFLADLGSGAVGADYAGDMRIEELERVLGPATGLPTVLNLGTRLGAYLADGRAELHEAGARLTRGPEQALIEFSLSAPLEVPLDQPAAVMDEEATRATLTLTALPLPWLNGLLAEPAVAEGALGGAFELVTGGGALAVRPLQPLGVEAATLTPAFGIEQHVRVSLRPRARIGAKRIEIGLDALSLALGDSILATLQAGATLARGSTGAAAPAVTVSGEIDLDAVARVPPLAQRLEPYTLPAGLAAAFRAALAPAPERIRISELEFSVAHDGAAPLVQVSALQPFAIGLGAGAPALRNPAGELALVQLQALDLAWLDPFVAGFAIGGTLEAGSFTLSAGDDAQLSLASREALRLRDVAVRGADGALVERLSLSVRPELSYHPERAALRYTALDARVGGVELLQGAGEVGVPLGEGSAERPLSARGTARVSLNALHRVAALVAALGDIDPQHRWRLDLDYDLAATPDRVDVSRLTAALSADQRTLLSLANATPLIVRPHIDADEPLARHLSGTFSAEVEDLSSALLADLVNLGPLAFDALSARATLDSDGDSLHADLGEALRLDGVRVSGADGPLLRPFSFTAAGEIEARGQRLEAALETVALAFAGDADAALSGSMSFALEPQHRVPLRHMRAGLVGHLPALLEQPALLPGHRLARGALQLEATVDEDGSIGGTATLADLAADSPLAVGRMQARADGAMQPDGVGFSFEMPLGGEGRSGRTDGLLRATYDPSDAEQALLELDFRSGRFYLNDVLAALDAIAAPRGKTAMKRGKKDRKQDADAEPATVRPVAAATEPDQRAFWDLLPYAARVDYRIDSLYYTDYVIFDDVAGKIDLTPTRLTLSELGADFHDSPMRFDGALDFNAGSAAPYDLQLAGTIKEFDLNQFFTELVPGSKPRVEGLFSVAVNGYGQSPNMAQYRNELLFDMKLASRAGLFRPLPPDSALMSGASDVLGVVGEGLSYLPTGGFGAGALSRLVNYIQVIDYDRIDIHVVRDDSRDIVIRQFLVQSPTISLTAHGGIDYADGKDILDSPLNLDARLNMSGKGAAILYSMDLLEDSQDEYGYYRGPQFRIRGTPAAAESNFAEIVQAAADGTVKGGVTRPLSGLIGNIKHRWLGDDPHPYQDDAPATDAAAGAPAEGTTGDTVP